MREDRRIGLGAGLAGVCLVIIVAWALAAVLMLTGTLTNARQINDRVKQVNAQVMPIDKNLSYVKLAQRTGGISRDIRTAAQNLSAKAAQIITAARSIDTKVSSILSKATSINGTVQSINGSVKSIGGSVSSIGGRVQTIGGSVASISGLVGSIHSKVATVARAVGPVGAHDKSINADVTQIRSRLGTTLTTAGSIRNGVVAINNRADVIIDLVRQLKGDFDPILAGVGTTIGGPNILGHANSIDCAALINLLGATSGCGR